MIYVCFFGPFFPHDHYHHHNYHFNQHWYFIRDTRRASILTSEKIVPLLPELGGRGRGGGGANLGNA